MTVFSGRGFGTAIAVATVMVLTGGCVWNWWCEPPGTGNWPLRHFESGDEMLEFFRQEATARVGERFELGDGWVVLDPNDPRSDGGELTVGWDASEADRFDIVRRRDRFSTADLRAEGIDESDVFRSNGSQFFIARGRTVRIVQAVPASDMAEVGRVELGGRVDELYLSGTTLIAIGQRNFQPTLVTMELEDKIHNGAVSWPPYWPAGRVVVTAVDVSNPAAPTVIGEIELDGVLLAARLVEDRLRLAMTYVPPALRDPGPAALATMGIEDVLPKARVNEVEEVAIGWEDFYRPESPDGYVTTALVTLDAGDVEHIIGAMAVMADTETVYASQGALYITDDDWVGDHAADRRLTAVHKFVFDRDLGARYFGSGAVFGRLRTPFTLSEYAGYLRAGTYEPERSTGEWGDDSVVIAGEGLSIVNGRPEGWSGSQDTANAVYVLGPGTNQLELVGGITNLSSSLEPMYGVRFAGSHAFYLSDYRDSFPSVLDLSDPTRPAVLGHLLTYGPSQYLCPFGENLLVGVGLADRQYAHGVVILDDVQLSLFDVTDLGAPTLIEEVQVGGFGSFPDVGKTSKTLVSVPEQGLLAFSAHLMPDEDPDFFGCGLPPGIPTTSCPPPDLTTVEYVPAEFEGVLCYRVSGTGFEELGRIAVVNAGEWPCEWRRVAIIGETVYALSEDGVRAAPLSDLSSAKTLEFEDAE